MTIISRPGIDLLNLHLLGRSRPEYVKISSSARGELPSALSLFIVSEQLSCLTAKPLEPDKTDFASRQGRRTRIRSNANAVPAPFQGAHASVSAFPVVTLGLHHRLISAAPPSRTFVGKPMADAPLTVPPATSIYFTWILTPYNTLVRSREQNYGDIPPQSVFARNTVSKTPYTVQRFAPSGRRLTKPSLESI